MTNEMTNEMTRPSFLADVKNEGTEKLKNYLIPSVIRVVQKNSSDGLLSKFQAGQVLILPEEIMIADKDEMATFIPLFFYVEYCAWNPRAVKDIEGSIRARTFDANSEIAIKARDPEKWAEPHPDASRYPNDNMDIRYQEHLNYMVMVQHEFAPVTPCVISFSSTGHMIGRKFANLITARNAPIYAGKYEMMTTKQSNAKGDWYQFSISNAGWCTETEFDLMKFAHEELRKKRIVTDYESDEKLESAEY